MSLLPGRRSRRLCPVAATMSALAAALYLASGNNASTSCATCHSKPR